MVVVARWQNTNLKVERNLTQLAPSFLPPRKYDWSKTRPHTRGETYLKRQTFMSRPSSPLGLAGDEGAGLNLAAAMPQGAAWGCSGRRWSVWEGTRACEKRLRGLLRLQWTEYVGRASGSRGGWGGLQQTEGGGGVFGTEGR